MNPVDQQYLNALNCCFVSLCWVDCEIDAKGDAVKDPRIFCTSGFVIEYQGEWLWITAGHLLNDLDNKLPVINRRMVKSQLVAGWNSNEETVQRIPFEYGTCVKYFVDDDDEGTDLGIIYIAAEMKQALRKVGVVPLRKLDLPEQEYEQYMVHGLPKKEQRDDIQESEGGIDCAASVMPVAFRVFPFTSGTAGFPATKRRLFYASVPAEVTLETLDGVSGGPIYALKQETDRIDFYLAAVQNREKKSSKTIAACPSALFHEILAKGLADIKKQLSS
ncbi:MAG: hypothetical protein GXY83_16725 [Rhodopirellula sp.]|nr:hypothetical protein [Rhodopirellula sp.]